MKDKSSIKPEAKEKNWIEISDPSRLPEKPVVSVLMLTYNHAPYLAEAIEGVLMQQTDFPIELLIGEDCSPDNTREIAEHYQREYPQLIRVITSEHNVGITANFTRLVAAAKGEFVAFCEGDDYWIDTKKLTDQVNLIRGNQSISVVYADHVIRYDFWGKEFILNPDGRYSKIKDVSYLEEDALNKCFGENGELITHTSTILFRYKDLQSYFLTEFVKLRGMSYDRCIAAYLSTLGMFAYLNRPVSAYRITPGSMMRSGAKSSQKMAMEIREFFVIFSNRYNLYKNNYIEIYKKYTFEIFIASFELNDNVNFLKSGNELKSLELNADEKRMVFIYSKLFVIPILRILLVYVKNIFRYCRTAKEKIFIFMGFRKCIVLNQAD